MPIDRLGGGVSWPAAVVIVALLLTFVALVVINPSVALVVGIMVLLFGGDFLRELSEAVSPAERTAAADRVDTEDALVDTQDALDRLRVRYADGELSDVEFERRLETLLETETVDDVEAFLDEGRVAHHTDLTPDPSKR